MTTYICPRCLSKFFTAIAGIDLNCPFCGFLIQSEESRSDNRLETRHRISKDCYLVKGGRKVPAHAVDISNNGIGVVSEDTIPFDANDELDLVIEDMGFNSSAQIIWSRKHDAYMFKAGLRFC
ncbi:MAG: PilZ domain-containing protein [Deltaproteobacteria bacterium]|nr:PilZ domain-containing protein [Deltaproteobacteria bacterium]